MTSHQFSVVFDVANPGSISMELSKLYFSNLVRALSETFLVLFSNSNLDWKVSVFLFGEGLSEVFSFNSGTVPSEVFLRLISLESDLSWQISSSSPHVVISDDSISKSCCCVISHRPELADLSVDMFVFVELPFLTTVPPSDSNAGRMLRSSWEFLSLIKALKIFFAQLFVEYLSLSIGSKAYFLEVRPIALHWQLISGERCLCHGLPLKPHLCQISERACRTEPSLLLNSGPVLIPPMHASHQLIVIARPPLGSVDLALICGSASVASASSSSDLSVDLLMDNAESFAGLVSVLSQRRDVLIAKRDWSLFLLVPVEGKSQLTILPLPCAEQLLPWPDEMTTVASGACIDETKILLESLTNTFNPIDHSSSFVEFASVLPAPQSTVAISQPPPLVAPVQRPRGSLVARPTHRKSIFGSKS